MGGLDAWGTNNVYTNRGAAGIEVAIFSRGPTYNVVVLSNAFNGDISLNNTITNVTLPLTQSEAVNTNNFDFAPAPDGFVWFQFGGNFFVAGNIISNNQLEAVQLNTGPNAVVGNRFGTVVSHSSACAICAYASSQLGLTGTSNDYWTTFVGNSVYGNRMGERAHDGVQANPFSINVSGNLYNLFPAFDGGVACIDYPSAAVLLAACRSAYVLDNMVVSAGLGVLLDYSCTNALIMDNDFSGVTYRSIGYHDLASPSTFLPNARCFGISWAKAQASTRKYLTPRVLAGSSTRTRISIHRLTVSLLSWTPPVPPLTSQTKET
jgi:hypothetical protein